MKIHSFLNVQSLARISVEIWFHSNMSKNARQKIIYCASSLLCREKGSYPPLYKTSAYSCVGPAEWAMFVNTVRKAIYSLHLSLYKNGIGCAIDNICFGEFYCIPPILNRNSCKALYWKKFVWTLWIYKFINSEL